MQFGMVGRMVQGWGRQLGFGIGPWEGVLLEANVGRPTVTTGEFAALQTLPKSLCDFLLQLPVGSDLHSAKTVDK